MGDKIDLVTAVEALRKQLERLAAPTAGRVVRFEIPSVELELHVAVEKSTAAEGGVSFTIFGKGLEASGGGTRTTEEIQTLRVQLKPTVVGNHGEVRSGTADFSGRE